MDITSTPLLLSSTLIFFIFFLNAVLSHFTRRKLPPGPIGLPIFGNLFQVGPKPHVSFAKLAKEYGPLISMRLGSMTSVIVSSPEIAREILQKHDENFCDRVVPDIARGQANFDISMVWLPAGNRWRMLRQVMNTHLTHGHKLDSLVECRHKAVLELVEYVKDVSKRGGTNNGESLVDIENLGYATALNQMSKTCFSKNVTEYDSKEIKGFMKAVKSVMYVVGQFNIADVFPWLKPMDPQNLRQQSKEAYGWLEGVVDVFVNERMQWRKDQITNSTKSSSKHKHNDLLDSFIDYSLEDPDFNPPQFKILLLELFLAGSDTTSITIEWAMTELILNPEKMERLRQEITDAVGTKGKVEEQDIMSLPYLQAVIKETMRLRPAVPLLIPHKCMEDVEINGYVIPRNAQIILNAWAMARDPLYWESPNKFLPERFLNSNMDYKGHHFGFIPFGSGRRMCPGIPVAQRVVSLVVASLVYHFDWKLPRGTTIDNLDMDDGFGLTLRKTKPLLAAPTLIKEIKY